MCIVLHDIILCLQVLVFSQTSTKRHRKPYKVRTYPYLGNVGPVERWEDRTGPLRGFTYTTFDWLSSLYTG